MKLFVVSAVAGLIFSLAGTTPAHEEKTESQPGEKIERSMPVSPQVTVTLCVSSGTLTVRGWDKNELRVRSATAGQIELRRLDKGKDPAAPATRIDVMIQDMNSRMRPRLDCQALTDVTMEVPAGATVQVQTRDGDISIVGVSAVYAGSQNGNIAIERAVRIIEAGSVGGSISLKDSSGRVNLSSAGGIVEVVNVKPANSEDSFEVGTVSGDIQLDRVSNPKVMAKTVNGTVTMTGPLARSGNYSFTNMTGDVVLGLPHDASFQLHAKVSEKRDIVSDFTLKYIETPPAPPSAVSPAPRPGAPGTPGPVVSPAPAAKPGPVVQSGAAAQAGPTAPSGTPSKPSTTVPPKTPVAKGHPPQKSGPIILIDKQPVVVPYVLRRVQAICGTGDATISVASFGGTVRLKKL